MDKKIAFVYPPHPLHKKMADEIGADFFSDTKSLPRDYDIYIFEGAYIKPLFLKKIGKINKNSKIITLFSDPRLFYLYIGKKFDFKEDRIVKYPLWRAIVAKKLIKEVDGAICTSQFTANLFRKFNKKTPVVVTPGFIFKERFNKLSRIKPDLSNKNILFIGYGPDYYVKGMDLLLDVFKSIKEEIPNAELYILGGWWNLKKDWSIEGVHFEGIQDIVPYLKKSALSIHLGRGESFGINILETMLAGIPTMVSRYTGSKDAVIKVDKKLVVPLNKEVISKKILNYFDLSLKKRYELSEKCKKISGEFNEKRMIRFFKEQFLRLLEEIYKGEESNK